MRSLFQKFIRDEAKHELNASEVPPCVTKSTQYSWYQGTDVAVSDAEPGQVSKRRRSYRIWKRYNTEEQMLAHIGECGEALVMLADLAKELHRPVLTCEKMASR